MRHGQDLVHQNSLAQMDLLFPSGFFSGGRNTSWLPTGISNSGGDAGPTGATVGAGPEATAPGGLPSGVMDTFLATAGRSSPLMQVLLFVYRVLGAQLGLDPSVLLTLLGFLWGLSKIGSQLYVHVVTLIDRYFACSITIPDSDSIYDHLMEWLSHQKSIRNNRFLMAKTVYKTAWEDEEGIEKSLSRTGGESGDQYLNFSNHAASQVCDKPGVVCKHVANHNRAQHSYPQWELQRSGTRATTSFFIAKRKHSWPQIAGAPPRIPKKFASRALVDPQVSRQPILSIA